MKIMTPIEVGIAKKENQQCVMGNVIRAINYYLIHSYSFPLTITIDESTEQSREEINIAVGTIITDLHKAGWYASDTGWRGWLGQITKSRILLISDFPISDAQKNTKKAEKKSWWKKLFK